MMDSQICDHSFKIQLFFQLDFQKNFLVNSYSQSIYLYLAASNQVIHFYFTEHYLRHDLHIELFLNSLLCNLVAHSHTHFTDLETQNCSQCWKLNDYLIPV